MDTRRRIIIAVLIVATLVVAALFIWLLLRPRPQAVVQTNANANISLTPINTNANVNVPPLNQRIQTNKTYPLGLKQVAASFAERYGSYSTDEPAKNLEELAPLMTLKLQQQTAQAIADRTSTPAIVFSGYNTRALSVEIISQSDLAAQVTVQTQRARYVGAAVTPQLSYADLSLKLVKIGQEWRVDSAEWK